MVTPSDPEQRGCCLALRLSCSGDEVVKKMLERGIAVSIAIACEILVAIITFSYYT